MRTHDSRSMRAAEGVLPAPPGSRRSRRRLPTVRRRSLVAIGALFALACTAMVYFTAGQVHSQSLDGAVRIVASRQEDGRIEFALQQQQSDGSWNEHQLPERRFFPTTATPGQWLESSSLTASVSGDEVVVRIVASRQEDGRIEFALQQQQSDGSWNEHQLPERRFFPTAATPGQWLESSAVPLRSAEAPTPTGGGGQQKQPDPSPPLPDPKPPPPDSSPPPPDSSPPPPDSSPPPPDSSPPPPDSKPPPPDSNPGSRSETKSRANPPPPSNPPPPNQECHSDGAGTTCTRPLTEEERDEFSPTPPPPDPAPRSPTTTTTTPPPNQECQSSDTGTICARPLTPTDHENGLVVCWAFGRAVVSCF